MNRFLKHMVLILSPLLAGTVSVSGQDTYRVENLPFNSRISDEFAPMFFGNGIIFCSNRKNQVLKNYTTVDNQPLLDLYTVDRKDSTNWGNPKIMSKELASVFNEGPACFSRDGRMIYFTRNITADKKSRNRIIGENYYGIYTAEFDGSTWGNIKPFPYNSPQYRVGHPSISPDGKQLFFASDMPGGSGKSDLYTCTLEEGQWSTPVNLGASVNTAGSEIYPFYHPSGRLYFSSDQSGGSGGLDIYFTQQIGDEWVTPTRLPSPFNSPSDDFAFIADETIESGFFSSNRNRNDDIFMFTTLVPKYAGCDTLRENNYCYVFYETGSYNLDTVPFSYEWDMGDGTRVRNVDAEHCFSSPGDYTVKLNVIDKLTGEIQYSEASYFLPIREIEQAYIACVDTGYAGDDILFDGQNTNLPGFSVGEYLWNFDDGNIATGATARNRYNSPGIYQVQLVVKSTPDNQGNVREACVSKQVVVLDRRRRSDR